MKDKNTQYRNEIVLEPFESAINGLLNIANLESPMCKVEQIFTCCTKTLQT